jgi:hypothetical protein
MRGKNLNVQDIITFWQHTESSSVRTIAGCVPREKEKIVLIPGPVGALPSLVDRYIQGQEDNQNVFAKALALQLGNRKETMGSKLYKLSCLYT